MGFYDDAAIVDTPVYQGYGDAMLAGEVPYRDFALEYPPLALPVFLLPSLGEDEAYGRLFELLMLVLGAAAVALVAWTLGSVGAAAGRLAGGVAFAALAPLLLGPVILTRYDLWPAALTAGALAALVAGHGRLALGVLGAAVAAKLYPVVLLPLALLYVARRDGRREALASLAAFGVVVATAFVPFLLLAPEGLAESLERQMGRPLQIESLGAGLLLAAGRLGLYEPAVVSTHGSQNLTGALPDALATGQAVLQALAVVAVWALFARGRGDGEALLVASAAAVAAFVAFGKVLSPQYLVWLLPLVPLVAGRAGVAASAVLALGLIVTQLWFPYRYWDVVALRPVAWLVLVRDLALIALFVVLAAATARARGSPRSA